MLVTVQIRRVDPIGLGTADALGVGVGDDQIEYLMKDGSSCPSTPHDEWFCTRLAETVGIACPSPHVLRLLSGELIFGSRWEGGVAKDPWWDMVDRGDIELAEIAPVLSRIFAFDCFVHNDDRHLNNYLVSSGRHAWRMLAMDYSRAWYSQGIPPPPLPFAASDNTLIAIRDLRRIFPGFFDVSAASALLDKLLLVTDSEVSAIIDSHPAEWLTPQAKAAVLQWWRSQDRTDRIEGIRKGIVDGTYF